MDFKISLQNKNLSLELSEVKSTLRSVPVGVLLHDLEDLPLGHRDVAVLQLIAAVLVQRLGSQRPLLIRNDMNEVGQKSGQ